MLGIVFGTLCFIMLLGVMRRERYRRYGFAYGGGPFGHHNWRGLHHRLHHHGLHHGLHDQGHEHAHFSHARGPMGPIGRGDLVNGVLSALNTTPGQDRAIAQAFETFFARVREASKTRESAHAKIASALAGDTLDAQALQAGLLHEGEVGSELRAELAATLSKIHEALEPQQRKLFAEMIEEGLLARYIGRSL